MRLTLAAAPALAGCYRAVPIAEGAPLAAGQRVVAVLTDRGARVLGPQLGAGVAEVEGLVDAVRGDTLALVVLRTHDAAGIEHPWQRQVVPLPRELLRDARARRLDRRRSWLAALGVAAMAVAARSLLGGGAGGGGAPVGVLAPN